MSKIFCLESKRARSSRMAALNELHCSPLIYRKFDDMSVMTVWPFDWSSNDHEFCFIRKGAVTLRPLSYSAADFPFPAGFLEDYSCVSSTQFVPIEDLLSFGQVLYERAPPKSSLATEKAGDFCICIFVRCFRDRIVRGGASGFPAASTFTGSALCWGRGSMFDLDCFLDRAFDCRK